MKCRTFISIVLVFLVSLSFAQNSAIKGFPIYSFTHDPFLAGLSLGYEHRVLARNSIDLSLFSILEHNLSREGGSIMIGFAPAFRHYFRDSDKRFNVYMSPYFVYLWLNSSGTHDSEKGYLLGAGVSAGIRFYFSSQNNWFIDTGFGVAYGQYTNTYYRQEIPNYENDSYTMDYTIPDPKWVWVPRPILQIGCRF